MPPANMHPRSKMTGTIFWGTLAASFAVVGLPHILPCPAPRITYQEGVPGPDGKIRRRKRCVETVKDGSATSSASSSDCDELEEIRLGQRPCPIPKPAVMVGKALGFKQSGSSTTSSEQDSNIAKPP